MRKPLELGAGLTLVAGVSLAALSPTAAATSHRAVSKAGKYRVIRTIDIGKPAYAVTIDHHRRRIYFAAGRTLVTMRESDGTLLGRTSTGADRNVLGIAVDNRRHVLLVPSYANSGRGKLTWVSERTGRAEGSAHVGGAPYAVTVDAGAGLAFTANHTPNTVSIISESKRRILRTVPVGESPMAIAYGSKTHKVYCVNQGGTVSVIDVATRRVVRTLHAGPNPSSIAVSGSVLYVVNNRGVDRIDAGTGAHHEIRLQGDPSSVAVDPNAGQLFVTQIGANALTVLNRRTGRRVARVKVGKWPVSLVVDPASRRVVTTSPSDMTASVITW